MMGKTLITAALGGALALVTGCASAPTSFDRGMAYYHNGEYLFAADAFDEAVRERPASAAAYTNRGVARARLGDLNGAIADYNQAVQLAPGDPAIYFNRGNALVASGQYGLAVEDFSRAIDLSPTFAKAWFNRGSARSLAGQGDAAMKDWLHAIDLEGDPWARTSMRRVAGLESLPAVAAIGAPVGQPTTAGTVASPPAPGTVTDAVPLPPAATVAVTPPVAPAASPGSPQSMDARALATRAISRELDGDREGALRDLRAALALERDPARRQSIETFLRILETPR
jgi:tetratricopeptide (TPR) repeat protein